MRWNLGHYFSDNYYGKESEVGVGPQKSYWSWSRSFSNARSLSRIFFIRLRNPGYKARLSQFIYHVCHHHQSSFFLLTFVLVNLFKSHSFEERGEAFCIRCTLFLRNVTIKHIYIYNFCVSFSHCVHF